HAESADCRQRPDLGSAQVIAVAVHVHVFPLTSAWKRQSLLEYVAGVHVIALAALLALSIAWIGAALVAPIVVTRVMHRHPQSLIDASGALRSSWRPSGVRSWRSTCRNFRPLSRRKNHRPSP